MFNSKTSAVDKHCNKRLSQSQPRIMPYESDAIIEQESPKRQKDKGASMTIKSKEDEETKKAHPLLKRLRVYDKQIELKKQLTSRSNSELTALMWKMGNKTIEYKPPALTAQEKKRDVETQLRHQQLIDHYFKEFKIQVDEEQDNFF